jgi:diguanylate cyclase (GGDEF)-like protein/PAS domain S-box-containing protein
MPRSTALPPLAVAAIVFVLAAAGATSLILHSEKHNLRENQAQVAAIASDHGHALETTLERALSATYALAALVRQGNGKISNFDAVAGQMLQFYPGVSALELSPGGVIRYAVPLAGNEKAIGFDQLKDPVQSKEAFVARDTGRLTLAGPMDLAQGGLGAVGRLPVFLDDAQGKPYFWGFTNVVIRFPDALVGAGLPRLVDQGMDYELWRIKPDSGQKQMIAASSSKALIAPVEQNLAIAYGNWTLSVAPKKGWQGDLSGLLLKALLGLVFSLLLGYMTMLMLILQSHKGKLQQKVAERTRALEAANSDLAGREALLNQILDASSVAIFLVDMEGRITRANKRMAEMFGRPLDELAGQEYVSLIHPAEREVGRTKMLALLSSTVPSVEVDRLYRRTDQTEFWGHLTGRRFHDTQGVERGLIGVIIDITERKAIEEKLQRQNNMLSAIIENFPGGISLFDGDLRLAAHNAQFKQLMDLPSALLDKPDVQFEDFIRYNAGRGEYGPGDPEQQVAAIVARARNFKPHRFERQRANGTTLEIRGMPMSDGGFVTIYTDITERKAAEQHLRIAAIAFESQEGILVTDAARVILRVNHAFTRITGYTAEEAVGQTPHLLSSGRHDAAFYGAMTESLRSSGTWQGEIWNRRKNGEVHPEWLTITAVKDEAGAVTHYVATQTDITLRKTAEEEIRSLAFYDPLTRLPNRRLLLDRLQQAMASSARSEKQGALLFIDLDKFKTLNDTLGHDMGDLLLQQVAERLSSCVREGDTVARLGGDEFVVMLEDLSENTQEAATRTEIVGEKILDSLNQTYQLAGHQHRSTPSIGVTLFSDHQETMDELMKRADMAMYQAKAAGRNTLRFFDPDMQAAVTLRAAMEEDLRKAVVEKQFVLHYQPQVDSSGKVVGAEALVRWEHPERGMVSPAEFIPLAEETGLILPLGHWVLEMACVQLALWAARQETSHLTLAVNVSARQFSLPNLPEQVLAMVEHTGALPARLKLELTESLLLENAEDIIAKMTVLKARGVGFSMDDFGTGYSSLSYLKRLPLDQLKIDQSFVRDVLTDPNDAAIARTVIALGQSLGLAVIAEGVETEGQMEFLARHGCLAYQGYLFSRPLPIEGFDAFVRRS